MSGGDYASLTPVTPGSVPSSYGRDMRDSVLLRFASAASRTATFVTPLGAADEGMRSYLADSKRIDLWNGSAWVLESYVPPQVNVRKTSDESVTSSTVLQNDNELLLTYSANATYGISAGLFTDGATAGDLQVAFAFTAAAGTRISWAGPGPAETIASYAGDALFYARNAATTSPTSGLTYGLAGGTVIMVPLAGILVVGSTPGTLQLMWAQGTSSATATVVKTDSWLQLERVA